MSQKQNGQMVVDEKRLTVKVSNDVVKAVQPLNASELDLFFAIMAKMKNKGDTLVDIPIDKLIEITHYKGKRFNFYKECRDLFERLPALFITTRDGSKYRFITVFSEITVDVDTGALTAQINDRFVYVLNNLEKHFTIFELEEYVRLDGVHARQLYLLLKQWRKTGGRLPDGKKLLFKIEDIRAAFNLKDTYRTANIEQLIIKPILSQIEALFPNFAYTVVKGGNRGAVTGYHFTFDRETRKEYITAPVKALPPKTTATAPIAQSPTATAAQSPAAQSNAATLARLHNAINKGVPRSRFTAEERELLAKADYEQKEQEYWDKTDDANLKVFAEVNGKYPIGSLKDKEAPSGHIGRFAWERDNKGTMGGEPLIRYVELFPEIAELIKQAHPANVQATPAKKKFNPDYQDLCVPPHKRAQQQPTAAPTPQPVVEPEPERPRNVDPFAEFENDTNPDPFAGFYTK